MMLGFVGSLVVDLGSYTSQTTADYVISCFLGLIYDGLSMEVKFEGTLVQKPIVNAFTRWFSFFLFDGL